MTQADSYEEAALKCLDEIEGCLKDMERVWVTKAQVYATLELAKWTKELFQRGR